MSFSPALRVGLCALVLIFLANVVSGQQSAAPGQKPQTEMPSVTTVPPEAQPSDHFNAEAATNAYLAQIPAGARERSDAYFEGGYWLILWDFLYGVVLYFILLKFRVSAGMRNIAERLARFKPLQTFIYWVEFLVVSSILGFPLGVYEGFFREVKYGLATQTFGPWMWDQTKILMVNALLGGLLVMALVGIVRRLPNTWHIWGSIVTIAFLILGVMLAPVYIFPLLNTFKALDDPAVTRPVLRLARANGISVEKVYEVDASKQSTRMSANVSGFGKTMRITMNDNLLRRGSPEEIESVMGHEMGHYVLNHIPKDMLFLSVVTVIFFSVLKGSLTWSLSRFGDGWGLRGVTDPAVIPLVFLIGSIFFFVLTPITNTQTRTSEREADMYGLNASRQPDGFAQAAIHLGEYRKMSPTPLEEFVFFDHPSGRNRILAAMRWKAENLQLFAPQPAATGQPAAGAEPAKK
ncbi:MAG TPA: M48 family metallopeptidase [Candidatus Acidoferrum sp.]|nr:M48 family metallopeptidase [Candidatus Acidoferrum sp.]